MTLLHQILKVVVRDYKKWPNRSRIVNVDKPLLEVPPLNRLPRESGEIVLLGLLGNPALVALGLATCVLVGNRISLGDLPHLP